MLAQNRDAKRKETMNQIRKLLAKEKRTWQQLLAATKRSSATLGRFLDELIQQGEVKAYTDPKDRRITWYEPQKEKVEAQISRYEAIKFIEDIPNPVHVFRKKESKAIAVFSSVPNEQNRDNIKKAAEIVASFLLAAPQVKVLKDQRIAIVLMAPGGEKAE